MGVREHPRDSLMGQVAFRDRPSLFWAKVACRDDGECWPWLGCLSTQGYGRAGKCDYAHRLAYELEHGAIPPGVDVMHSCDFKPCCNPAHLSLGSRSDNMRDAVQKGRHYSPFSAAERARHGFPAGGPCHHDAHRKGGGANQ
jgi:hypothetical protein